MPKIGMHKQMCYKLPGFKQGALPGMQGKQVVHVKRSTMANGILCQENQPIDDEQVLNNSWQYLETRWPEFCHIKTIKCFTIFV